VKRAARKFDYMSAVLTALTFGLFITGIDGLGQGLDHLPRVCVQLAVAAVCGFLLVRRQLDEHAPLLPVDLMRIPIFALSVSTSALSFAGQMLAYVALPFYFQNVLGRDAVHTGLLMTPWPIAIMFVAPLAGRLSDRYPAGILGAIGLAVFAVGLASMALLPAEPTNFQIVWRMIMCGAGFALFQSPNNRTMIGSAPMERTGGASGMLGTARLLGQTTGTALVALIFNLFALNGTHLALFTAAGFAVAAGIVSSLRLTSFGRTGRV
jgi:DHA2 family multidrug resistance protein-like MFS transporter